jgi:hypothetical protein
MLSCSNSINTGQISVAEVGTKTLYLTDLKEIIPNGLNKNDSTLMADDYIKRWIKQQLLIQKAEENLSLDQKNVTLELEEYKNSIIIYKYKNELLKQRMDTVVNEEQIGEYYRANVKNFNLNKNIVKAILVKVPIELADPGQLKLYCSNSSEEGISELREYCLQYAKGFDIFMDTWVDFEMVMKNIPQDFEDPGQFLIRNNTIELNDSNYYYLACIHEYKLKNETAPMEYVAENIKNLILNRRKIEFLKQIDDNVYREGIRKNKFKIHNLESNEIK